MPGLASYLLLLLPVALGVLLLLTARGRRRPADAPPVCARCGYDVRGLPGSVCPECGSDLNVVGVRRPGGREPVHPFWRLAAWTGFVLLSVLLPLSASWTEVQRRWLTVYDVNRTNTLSAPRSGAYQRVDVAYRARSRGDNKFPRPNPTPERLTLTLALNNGTARTMEVTAPVGPGESPGYRYHDASGRTIGSAAGLDAGALAKWMADAGVSAADPQVRREVVELLHYLRVPFDNPNRANIVTVSSGDAFRGAGTSGSSGLYPARWSQYVPLGAALLVWLTGLPFMLRRRTPAGGP